MAGRTAFIHVDIDDLWSIGECYGVGVPHEQAGLVYRDALPRFRALFAETGVRATFFAVGRDVQNADKAAILRALMDDGHRVANHSWAHDLRYRTRSEGELDLDVSRTEQVMRERLGVVPRGFRAPGYGASAALLRVLARRGYAYDSSIMPGPWGWVFRSLDRRLQRKAGGGGIAKTQYSRFGEAFGPLAPYRVDPSRPLMRDDASPLMELPAATAPLLRLPFQAGVCMRLGGWYFRTLLRSFALRPGMPVLFLFHGADLADFSDVTLPFFRKNAFFNTPLERRLDQARGFIRAITARANVVTTEEWLDT